ncbi:MAG: HesA/MoeB/ThiF family protein [Rikenellaceae bacterium]|jgi:adenylyltransferase/sulfurtransferase|nr:HesA/MoeB/ThiF family protein [Rikenellaceae bacterium]
MKALSAAELSRYRRNIAVDKFGAEGQARLAEARVLVVGAGGLGSAALTYLAAAGVGKLGIVEFDVVSDSNLQRQILYREDDLWRFKIKIAAERLAGQRADLDIETFDTKFTVENAAEILDGYDLAVDCTDNFETRYILDYFCALTDKPMIYGSAQEAGGQVSVFNWGEAGCYADLYPEADLSGEQAGIEVGVLSPLPGIVGSIQAMEAVKVITGYGTPLVGRLLVIDAAVMQFSLYEV